MISPRLIFWRISLLFNFHRVYTSIVNWPRFYLECYGLVSGGYTEIKSRNGLKYTVRTGTIDLGILDEIVVRKTYFPREISFKDAKTIVDIGAHIGIFCITSTKLVSKTCKIIAIEPEENNFKLLQRNIANNKITTIQLQRGAVWKNSTNRMMDISLTNNAAHSFFFGKDCGRKQLVQTLTLSDIMKKFDVKRIDILKMDCEGSEYDILMNCSRALMSKIGSIILEYHKLDNIRNYPNLVKKLSSSGFKTTVITFPNGLIYASR